AEEQNGTGTLGSLLAGVLRWPWRIERHLHVLDPPVLVFALETLPEHVLGSATPAPGAFRNVTHEQEIPAVGNRLRRPDERVQSAREQADRIERIRLTLLCLVLGFAPARWLGCRHFLFTEFDAPPVSTEKTEQLRDRSDVW